MFPDTIWFTKKKQKTKKNRLVIEIGDIPH